MKYYVAVTCVLRASHFIYLYNMNNITIIVIIVIIIVIAITILTIIPLTSQLKLLLISSLSLLSLSSSYHYAAQLIQLNLIPTHILVTSSYSSRNPQS